MTTPAAAAAGAAVAAADGSSSFPIGTTGFGFGAPSSSIQPALSIPPALPYPGSVSSKARRRAEKRRLTVLDPQQVQQCRTGYTRLINVKEFAQRYTEMHTRLMATCMTLANEPQPDLSVDDLIVPTPFQVISDAIEKEVTRVEGMQEEMKKVAAEFANEAQRRVFVQQRHEATALSLFQQHYFAALVQAQAAAAQQQQQQQEQRNDGESSLALDDGADRMDEGDSDPPAADNRVQLKKEITMQARNIEEAPSVDASNTAESAIEAESHVVPMDTHDTDKDNEPPEAAAAAHAAADSDMIETRPHASAQLSDTQLTLSDLNNATAAAASPSLPFPGLMVGFNPNNTQFTSQLPLLPPDFGAAIPNYDHLMDPLKGIQKDRPKIVMKRGRTEWNCVTKQTWENEIKARAGTALPEPLAPNEVLLRVAIYHPTNYSKTQEFIVLGSAPLTSLRDRIYCLQDHTLDGPHTPSACFFIENKFYNDLRHPRAISYSETIVEWVKAESRSQNPGLAHFDQLDMHATTFQQLSIRLGSHYLYQHQGDCCHTIIFTQLCMADVDHVLNSRVYPLKAFQAKTKRRKCRVCDLYPAAYVTYGDKLANENPFFYCEECYRPLHYSYEGNLLYNDFQVYAYEHE